MQFRGTRIVRIAARDDATPRRAATADCEIGIVETHSTLGQRVEVRSFYKLVSVAAEIIKRDVVGDEENEIGAVVGLSEAGKNGECEKGESVHGIGRKMPTLLPVRNAVFKQDAVSQEG